MKPSYSLCMMFLLLGFSQSSWAQGCSDAGACSISDFKHDAHGNLDSASLSYVKLGFNYGLADYSITVFGAYAEYGRQLSEKLGFKVKLTGISQNGNEVSSTGLSDIFLTSNYSVGAVDVVGGLKIPLSDGNKLLDGNALPMDYQSSLGTYDMILGVGNADGKIIWSISYQQPLTQNNNQFDSAQYPEGSIFREIPTTRGFDRAGDLLARVSYPIALSEKLVFTPSALPIYHLRNDRYINDAGELVDIENSSGLTFNLNMFLDLKLNSVSGIQFGVAAPLVVREVRPDGLTRGFVANLEYKVRF